MAILDLDATILAAVAQLGDEAEGVAIRERAGRLLGGRAPSVGTTYLALSRLERGKMLRARIGDPTPVRGGRGKRIYVLTAAGVRALERARHSARERAG